MHLCGVVFGYTYTKLCLALELLRTKLTGGVCGGGSGAGHLAYERRFCRRHYRSSGVQEGGRAIGISLERRVVRKIWVGGRGCGVKLE